MRVGSAKLVVGGTDQALCRKASFSLSPGRVTASALDQLVGLSRETYNAAWQHRRDAWARARVSVGRFDQFDEIPEIRAVRPDVVRFGNQPLRGAVSRGRTATLGPPDISEPPAPARRHRNTGRVGSLRRGRVNRAISLAADPQRWHNFPIPMDAK